MSDVEGARKAQGIEVRLFGAPDVTGPGAGELLQKPRRLALLVYLAGARPFGFQRRDEIVALFWPNHRQAEARAALRKAAAEIRKSLGSDALLSRGDEDLALNPAHARVDARRFTESLQRTRLAEALELYRGEFLRGFHVDGAPALGQWIDGERLFYAQEASEAAWALAERYETGSDMTSATRWARRAAVLAPTDERRIRRVMTMLDRAGDRAGAISEYRRFCEHLRRELELEPSAETRELARRIAGAPV